MGLIDKTNFPLKGPTTDRGAWTDSHLPVGPWESPCQALSREQGGVLLVPDGVTTCP